MTGTTWGSGLATTVTKTADANYARLTESVRENVPFIDPVLDAQQEAIQAGADHLWGMLSKEPRRGSTTGSGTWSTSSRDAGDPRSHDRRQDRGDL